MFLRQRRRLALFALMTALPFAALIFASVWPVWATLPAIGVAALCGIALMALPLLILRFAPRYRSACEGAIIGVFVGIALQMATLPLADMPMIGPWSGILGLALLILFFTCDLPNRLLPRRDYVGQHSFRTHLSTYTLWADHLPDPGLLDRHWTNELHNLVMDRRDPHVRIATYRTPDGEMRQRQRIIEETTYASFSYDFTQLLDDGSDGPTGSYGMTIEDHGAHRKVAISQRVDKLPIMAWLSTWLDDIVGDECDHHAARALGLTDTSITGDRHRQAPHRLVGPKTPEPMAA